VEFGDVISHIRDGIDTLLNGEKPHFQIWLSAGGLRRNLRLEILVNHPDPKELQTVPLYTVTELGFLSMTRHLLSKRPHDINIRFGRRMGYTLLHTAVHFRRVEFIKLLLKYGADMEIRGLRNMTPLHVASQRGYVDIVQLLLNYGTGDNDRRVKGTTLLRQTTSLRRTFARTPIVPSTGVHAREFYGRTPLHYASLHGHHQVVQLLLDRGADVDAQDRFGHTPLHLVSQDVDFPRLGFDIAAIKTTCMLLLDSGAGVNRRDGNGQTPLHLATMCGCCAIVQLLLGRGAAVVDAQDKQHSTALHQACLLSTSVLYWEVDVIKTLCELLLASGANVHLRNKARNTPYQLALSGKFPEIVQLLSDHTGSKRKWYKNTYLRVLRR
jgi:ankyrin repeat protein